MKWARVFVLAMVCPLFSCGCDQEEPWVVPEFQEADIADLALHLDEERGGYMVGDYRGNLPYISIPAKATGEEGEASIVGIEADAFYNRKELKGVNIGPNVRYIGEYAFEDSGVEELYVNDKLDELSPMALAGANIKRHQKDSVLYLPSLDFEYKYVVGYQSNDKFPDLTIQEGCVGIADNSFDGMEGYLRFPSSIRAIGNHGARDTSITVPEELTLTYLGKNGLSSGESRASWSQSSLAKVKKVTFVNGSRGFQSGAFDALGATEINLPVLLREVGALFSDDEPRSTEERTVSYDWTVQQFKTIPGSSRLIASPYTNIKFAGASVGFDVDENEAAQWLSGSVLSKVRAGLQDQYFPEIRYHGSLESWLSMKDRAYGDRDRFDLYFDGEYCTNLTIDSLENVGKYAFARTSLKSIVIGEGVKEIPPYAFAGCQSLQSVTLPSTLEKIGEGAFNKCTSLSSITIPASVKEIGDKAFENDEKIKTVNFSKGLVTLKSACFRNCSALTAANLPEGVETIGEGAFAGCASLESLSLPQSLNVVHRDAFGNTPKLTKTNYGGGLYLGSTGKGSDYKYQVLLQGDGSRRDIEVNQYCRVIASYAFYRTNIQSLNVLSGVNLCAIGENAIASCTALTKIDLSGGANSLRYLGNNFTGCGFVDKIGEALTFFTECRHIGKIPEGLFDYFYYRGDVASYLKLDKADNPTPWKLNFTGTVTGKTTEVEIPEGITAIPENAFAHCADIVSVDFPSTIKEIAPSAFNDTPKLAGTTVGGVNYLGSTSSPYLFARSSSSVSSVAIPEGCLSIADSAFANQGLSTISLPSSLKAIGREAFVDCKNLKEIEVPSGVSFIGQYAFRASGLTKAGIPVVGSSIFKAVTTLEDLSIGGEMDSQTDLGELLFESKTTPVRKLTFLEGVEALNERQFVFLESSPTLGELVLPSSLKRFTLAFAETMSRPTRISFSSPNSNFPMDASGVICQGDRVFFVPKDLKEANVVIPEGVTYIPAAAFQRCSLSSIQLPSTLKRIGGSAFEKCTLRSITLPSGLEEIGDYAFAEAALTDLDLPASLKVTGLRAFYGLKLNTLTLRSIFTFDEAFGSGSVQEIRYAGSKDSWPYYSRKMYWFAGIGSTVFQKDIVFID